MEEKLTDLFNDKSELFRLETVCISHSGTSEDEFSRNPYKDSTIFQSPEDSHRVIKDGQEGKNKCLASSDWQVNLSIVR